ncbi:MAG: hypothetical protein ACJ8KC_04180 [Candidatus Udaeobacter sp.]
MDLESAAEREVAVHSHARDVVSLQLGASVHPQTEKPPPATGE